MTAHEKSPAPIRVLIADDHAIVRKGLRDILSEAHIAAAIEEAQDGHEALAKGLAGGWDIVVLDITMPGPHGLEVLRQLKQARPELCVLILSMHADPQYIRSALRAGAAGYVAKETAAEELVTAVNTVLAGGTYLAEGLAGLL